MIRYLFKCQNPICKNLWAFDYEDRQPAGDPRRPLASSPIGNTTPEMDKIRGCPVCKTHKRPKMARINGIYSGAVKCDERCTEATGARCTCSCAGVNHGRAHIKEDQ